MATFLLESCPLQCAFFPRQGAWAPSAHSLARRAPPAVILSRDLSRQMQSRTPGWGIDTVQRSCLAVHAVGNLSWGDPGEENKVSSLTVVNDAVAAGANARSGVIHSLKKQMWFKWLASVASWQRLAGSVLKAWQRAAGGLLLAALFVVALVGMRAKPAFAAPPRTTTLAGVTVAQQEKSPGKANAQATPGADKALTVDAVAAAKAATKDPVDSLFKQAHDHLQAGHVLKARKPAQEALDILEKEKPSTKKALGYQLMAEVYNEQDKPQEALSYIQKAIEVREGVSQEGDPLSRGDNLEEIGNLYQIQGNFDKALPAMEEAVALYESAGEPGQEHLVAALARVASLHTERGDLDLVIPLFERVVEIQQRAGAEQRDIAGTLNTMAALENAQGNHVEAEGLARRALAEVENDGPKSRPELGSALAGLARALSGQEKFEEALPFSEQAVMIQAKTVAKGDPALAASVSDLASIQWMLGDLSSAEKLFLRVQDMVKGEPESEAAVCESLAGLYLEQGSGAKAIQAQKDAITLQDYQEGDPRLPVSLYHLGTLHMTNKEPAQAVPVLEKAQKLWPEEDPQRWLVLGELGGAYLESGKFQLALPVLQEAAALAETGRVDNSEDFAGLWQNLAKALEQNGQHEAAARSYERALQEVTRAGEEEGELELVKTCREGLERAKRKAAAS